MWPRVDDIVHTQFATACLCLSDRCRDSWSHGPHLCQCELCGLHREPPTPSLPESVLAGHGLGPFGSAQTRLGLGALAYKCRGLLQRSLPSPASAESCEVVTADQHPSSHTCTYTHTCMHLCTHTHIHMHTHIHTYTHTHTRACTYTHIHTHTHTRIHIHTYTCMRRVV